MRGGFYCDGFCFAQAKYGPVPKLYFHNCVRLATACWKLQPSAKNGYVNTNDNLKAMMIMMAIPPADDEEFRSWKLR